jgi:hypothetical protein
MNPEKIKIKLPNLLKIDKKLTKKDFQNINSKYKFDKKKDFSITVRDVYFRFFILILTKKLNKSSTKFQIYFTKLPKIIIYASSKFCLF